MPSMKSKNVKRRRPLKGVTVANENFGGWKPEFIASQAGYESFKYNVPSPAGMPIFVFASLRRDYEIVPIGARILGRGAMMIPTTFLQWSHYGRYLSVMVEKPATNSGEARMQFNDWIWKTFPLFDWTPRMVNMVYV